VTTGRLSNFVSDDGEWNTDRPKNISLLLVKLDPEDEGTILFRNVGNYSSNNAASLYPGDMNRLLPIHTRSTAVDYVPSALCSLLISSRPFVFFGGIQGVVEPQFLTYILIYRFVASFRGSNPGRSKSFFFSVLQIA